MFWNYFIRCCNENLGRIRSASEGAMDARRWARLSCGVTNGLEAWLWYGVVEYVLCTIVPVLFWPYAVVTTAQWRGTAELFACYGVIGAILGAASAFCVDSHGRLTLAEFSRRSQA